MYNYSLWIHLTHFTDWCDLEITILSNTLWHVLTILRILPLPSSVSLGMVQGFLQAIASFCMRNSLLFSLHKWEKYWQTLSRFTRFHGRLSTSTSLESKGPKCQIYHQSEELVSGPKGFLILSDRITTLILCVFFLSKAGVSSIKNSKITFGISYAPILRPDLTAAFSTQFMCAHHFTR